MPIIPFTEGSGGNAYIQKALLNALVLTIQESRKFKQLVKDKATGTPQGCFICTARSVPYINRVEGELYTNIGVGLSALLVSTNWAMREPLNRGTSDRTGSMFFCVYGLTFV